MNPSRAYRHSSALLACVVWGCTSAPAPPARTLPHSAVGPARPAPAATATHPPVKELPALNRHFEAERVSGTIALLDTNSGELGCSDVARCSRAVIPASTFKIPHSLIALELGLLDDAESPMPWDGKERPIAEWNQDHTLRSAMRVSCVPCFQAIARRVGAERMQEWLVRLNFGNRDISGGIDQFWLRGGLRISPLEQIEFLRRLDTGTLPVKPKSLDVVKDVITLDVGLEHVFRGKTGWAGPGDSDREYGWFVGWVELDTRRVYFATLIDGRAPDVDMIPVRRRLTETILHSLAVLPGTQTPSANDR
ncbi:MAG TPA: penicillin-binding transpeptidase domain-containing protein [Polyangiaceae bacterium]|nr:penicillin-binding transpeptidase domain-containing protein [Polyangiaceae bacterium]